MAKVSVEVHSKTARFAVAVRAQSIQRALSIAPARHPTATATIARRKMESKLLAG